MRIKVEDITKEHVQYALHYIVHHGQRGRNGIFYLYHPPFNRGVEHKVNSKTEYVAVRETVRIAILYAMQEIPEDGKVSIEAVKSVSWIFTDLKANPRAFVIRLGFQFKIFSRDIPEDDVSDGDEQNIGSDTMDKVLSLLRQIGQIIFYGPPGTGKTFLAKKMLPSLLDLDAGEVSKEEKRWDIVQFHPSYNYEDFVRGVKAKTVDNNVVYETIDGIFGIMCKRAKDDPENDYALIIDEINRADVSSVFGELIYALEYRDKEVKTPYDIGGDYNLIVPENLYIIGTMNTADRTIGKIDYAVRRRFAFVHCPPDENVIEDEDALNVFSDVNAIFDEHISSDYDAADVRIGHSYFMAESIGELAHKIVYQVVPILREYVKDGVLLKSAGDGISKIEYGFKHDVTIDEESGNVSYQESKRKIDTFYYWGKEGRFVSGEEGIKDRDDTVRRCCLVNIKDMPNRCDWDSCEDIGFILACGVSSVEGIENARGRIRRIQPGYIVIASLLPDSEGNGGVIGMGEVLAAAVPINEFKVNGIPILDYEFGDGQKYREKFPLAAADADDAERCDWMAAVKWTKTLFRKDAEGPSRLPRIVSRVSPGKLNIINRKFGGSK